MFKPSKFNEEESISNKSQAKSSVARGIRASIVESYPSLESTLLKLWPKKSPMFIVKCRNQTQLIVVEGEVLFFQVRDKGQFYPSLRMLHRYPSILPPVTVDTGAIRHVMSGSDIMDRGMTSAGGKLPEEDLPEGSAVMVLAEGKQHALAVGRLMKSVKEIRTENSGKGVELLHYLGDGLWDIKKLT